MIKTRLWYEVMLRAPGDKFTTIGLYAENENDARQLALRKLVQDAGYWVTSVSAPSSR